MFFPSKKKRLWRARVKQPPVLPAVSKGIVPGCSGNRRSEATYCLTQFCPIHPQHQPEQSQSHVMSDVEFQTEITADPSSSADNSYSFFVKRLNPEINGADLYRFDQEMRCQEMETKSAILQSPPSNQQTSGVFRSCCCGEDSNGSVGLDENDSENCNANFDAAQSYAKQKEYFHALTGKLKESQISTLLQAVDRGSRSDDIESDCVLIQHGTLYDGEANVIACQLWRWPEVKTCSEIKRIPSCPNARDPIYVCCNPYHWSRISLPDGPPPPYQSITMNRLENEDHLPNESSVHFSRRIPGSFTTDGEDSTVITGWCQLAYWEQAKRVGRRFPVESSSVNVFSGQCKGQGMCLQTLAEQRQSVTPEAVRKVRQKIGLGVTLSHEADGVWLYNRSLTSPVFVHSPTLNELHSWNHVSKVPPGHCLKAYDFNKAKSHSLVWPTQVAGAKTGPIDVNSMRISFVKGWGPKYSRQDVTACPCWLEVILSRQR